MKNPKPVKTRLAVLVAFLMMSVALVPNMQAQDLGPDCGDEQIASIQTYMNNARGYWLEGKRQQAIDAAYLAHATCETAIRPAMFYANYLRSFGRINEAVTVLENVRQGYPAEARSQVENSIESIAEENVRASFVLKGRSGLLEGWESELVIQSNVVAGEAELAALEEVRGDFYSTPGPGEKEKVYYLPPGEYSVKLMVTESTFPCPDAGEGVVDGKILIGEKTLRADPGDVERVDFTYQCGGQKPYTLMALGAFVLAMFR